MSAPANGLGEAGPYAYSFKPLKAVVDGSFLRPM
jgi:hypothetical protein